MQAHYFCQWSFQIEEQDCELGVPKDQMQCKNQQMMKVQALWE